MNTHFLTATSDLSMIINLSLMLFENIQVENMYPLNETQQYVLTLLNHVKVCILA